MCIIIHDNCSETETEAETERETETDRDRQRQTETDRETDRAQLYQLRDFTGKSICDSYLRNSREPQWK